jgi:hypothetical protein
MHIHTRPSSSPAPADHDEVIDEVVPAPVARGGGGRGGRRLGDRPTQLAGGGHLTAGVALTAAAAAAPLVVDAAATAAATAADVRERVLLVAVRAVEEGAALDDRALGDEGRDESEEEEEGGEAGVKGQERQGLRGRLALLCSALGVCMSRVKMNESGCGVIGITCSHRSKNTTTIVENVLRMPPAPSVDRSNDLIDSIRPRRRPIG